MLSRVTVKNVGDVFLRHTVHVSEEAYVMSSCSTALGQQKQMIVRQRWQDVKDGWTVHSLEVNRSRPQDGFGSTDQQRGSTDQTRTEAQCCAELSTMSAVWT